MDPSFQPAPHREAVALIAGKPPVVKRVFTRLLPEIRARAFTVAGIESANALQRIRDQLASVPQGDQTWDQAKHQIADELEPYLGDGAERRAELVLRVNTFQAYSASIHEVGMADADTTHFQYLHGECAVPTPSHLALNGIILPKDDPFWETHTGPWGHLGCVCYKRPMNEDLVADAQAEDETKEPEDRNVLTPVTAKRLNHGEILRGGRRYDTSIDGPDNAGFKWSPGDFRIPLQELEKKYDPEVWSQFQTWAQQQALDDRQSVWDWLNSSPAEPPTAPAPVPAPETAVSTTAGLQLLSGRMKAAKFTPAVRATVLALPEQVSPLVENLKVASAGRKGAYYTSGNTTMYLKRDPEHWSGHPTTVVHEIGHHLHYQTGFITNSHTDAGFVARAKEDGARLNDWATKQIGHDWRQKLSGSPFGQVNALAKALGYPGDFTALPLEDKKRISRWGDTIMGITGGQHGFGHDRHYMQQHGLKEVFTHAWSGLVDNDLEFGKVFSGTTGAVRKVLKL